MISASQHRKYLQTSHHLDTLKGKHNRRRRTLKLLFDQQDGRCIWCGDKMNLWWERSVDEFKLDNPLKQGTFEHLTLKSQGGLFTLGNGACSCAECNGYRGSITYKSFRYLTDNTERYQKWKATQNSLRAQIAIRKKVRKEATKEKQKQYREAKQQSIFNIACMFIHYKRQCHVDYYEQFVYTRNYIKSIGEHYGLF